MNTCFTTRALALLTLVGFCVAGCNSQVRSNPGVIVSPTTFLLTPEPTVTATSDSAATVIPTATNLPARVTATPSITPAAPTATTAASPFPTATSPVPLSVKSIEIDSGEMHERIAVGETATIVATDQFIAVLLHLSQPLTARQRQNLHVQVNPNNWNIEYKNAPTADTFAFALRGRGIGRTDIEVSELPSAAPLHFALQVLAPTLTPTRTVPAAVRVIKLPDAGRTIHLQAGERALLQFPPGDFLDLKQTDQSILQVVQQAASSVLLVARRTGTTTLTLSLISACPRPNLHCVPVGTDLVFHFVVE